MKNTKLKQILTDIGLKNEEAEVYLAGLNLGKTTVLKLSKVTSLPRSTVYGVIDTLKQKALMRVELNGIKQVFVAENPEKLEIILENKKNEFTSKLPEFMALYRLEGGESNIKYYTGVESMRNIYSQTLKEIRPGEEYLVITNQSKWYNLDPEFSLKYIENRAKLNIKTKLLFQDSDLAREHKKYEKNYNQVVRILPGGTELSVDTIIMPKKLIILDLLPPYTTLVVENQSVIELQKQMFNLVWQSLVE